MFVQIFLVKSLISSFFTLKLIDFFFLHIEADCKFFEAAASFADFHHRIRIHVTLDLLCLSGLYFLCLTGLIKCGQLDLARLPQLNPKSVAILDQILNFSLCLSGLSAITDFKCFKKSIVFFEFAAGFESKSHFRHIKPLWATIFVPHGVI